MVLPILNHRKFIVDWCVHVMHRLEGAYRLVGSVNKIKTKRSTFAFSIVLCTNTCNDNNQFVIIDTSFVDLESRDMIYSLRRIVIRERSRVQVVVSVEGVRVL